MWRVCDRRVIARERSLRPRLLLLILQERGLLAFFPVVTHMPASIEIWRSNRAGVFWWKFARLQKSQSTRGFVGHVVCIAGFCTGSFANIFIGVDEAESCQGDVSWAALRARACGLITSETHLLTARSCMSIACRNIVASHAFSNAFATGVQENRALFAPVGRWRCQAASLRSKTPLLHVGFNENESHLSEIDMHLARSLSTDGREEVLSLEAMCNIVKFLAVAGEENGSGAGPVANSNDVSLDICWSISGGCERLVVASVAVGSV